jgi:hypothetical protein
MMYIKRYGRWVLVDFDLCAWQPEGVPYGAQSALINYTMH